MRIKNFIIGSNIETTLAIVSKQIRETKNGSDYLHLDLQDATGKIQGRFWSEDKSSIKWDAIENKQVYLFNGRVDEYQGKTQVIIDDIKTVESYDKSDFIVTLPKAEQDKYQKQLTQALQEITNPHLKKLLDIFFGDKAFRQKFSEAPAAKSVHDACIGGLLRHTMRLVSTAKHVCNMYDEIPIHTDLVITSLLFHDMEKITEYDTSGASIEYTDEGHFIGHTPLAMMKLYHTIRDIEDFPKDLENHLLHIIAAHAAEHDPVRLPSTIEANIVHYCDMLDSQINHFNQEWDKNLGSGWKKDYLVDRWCLYRDKV